MSHSLVQIYVHIVFSTKERFPHFVDDEISKSTHAYLGGICKNLGAPVLKVGGFLDHVHILCLLPRQRSIANLVWEIKRGSSRWLKTQRPSLTGFYWQRGYGAFSVSPSHLDTVSAYIEKQKEHHETEAFQDELRRLLDENNIKYDEAEIWD
jgi:REP-associated tyrosine transposase